MKHNKLFITALALSLSLSLGTAYEASAATSTSAKSSAVVKKATVSPSYTGVVTASALNVRTLPSPNSKSLGTIKKGTTVNVYSIHYFGKTKWYKVNFKNGYGYVSGSFLKLSKYVAPKPVVPKKPVVTPVKPTVPTKPVVAPVKPTVPTAPSTSDTTKPTAPTTTVPAPAPVVEPAPVTEPVQTQPTTSTDAVTALKKPTTGTTIAPTIQGYTFNGKGFGHGIGMTQYGAKGMADQGFLYQDILKYYYTGVAISQKDTSNQNMRVALSLGQSSISVSSAGTYSLVESSTGKVLVSAPAGVSSSITYSNGTYSIAHNGTVVKTINPISVKATGTAPLQHKGKLYLGTIEVSYATTTTLDAVNHVNVETYLRGVVPGEMYVSWHNEALKAQTLAARTYALKNLRPTRNFDVYDDTRSQVYGGFSLENAKVTSLIEATKGEVVTYNGALIDALYSASAGGHTIDSEDLYNYSPYLRGKPDPYDTSTYVTTGWTTNLTLTDLSAVFTEVGKVKEIKVLSTKYYRPTSLQIIGDKTSVTVSGNTFRSRVGSTKIKSTMFTFKTY